jgi:hypothetical protein
MDFELSPDLDTLRDPETAIGRAILPLNLS